MLNLQVFKASSKFMTTSIRPSAQLSSRYCSGNSNDSNDESNQTLKTKRRKSPKYIDPNYPKRPLNAYLRFWLSFQPQIMDKIPDIKLTKAAEIAGKEWYNMADTQRDDWQKESQPSFEEFRRKIDIYRENDGYKKWAEMKQSLPKKSYPRSPVAVYIRENYKKVSSNISNQNKTNREIMQSLAQQWKIENDFIKNKYKEIWNKEKQEFVSKYGQYLKNSHK